MLESMKFQHYIAGKYASNRSLVPRSRFWLAGFYWAAQWYPVHASLTIYKSSSKYVDPLKYQSSNAHASSATSGQSNYMPHTPYLKASTYAVTAAVIIDFTSIKLSDPTDGRLEIANRMWSRSILEYSC